MINELEFTVRFLGQYKTKRNGEIQIKTCPFCHRSKNKFFLNYEKHTYICHSGSCGQRGKFSELCKLYGERAEYLMDVYKKDFEFTNNNKKTYSKPTDKIKEMTDKSKANMYINLRGITELTTKAFKVGEDSKGNITMPYYNEVGEHVLTKYRIPRKFIKDKDKLKTWQEGNGQPVLFGMQNIDINEPVIITEGEFDAMSVYECGLTNVVSIPFGVGNIDWISECWEWLKGINQFILWFDNDAAGKKGCEEVVRKLGAYRCKVINNKDVLLSDANEIMFKKGKDKVIELVNAAEFVPISHLQSLADCISKKRERIMYGNKFLDYKLGGCGMGEVVIWTGKRGSGKSTILNQTIIDTVKQKAKCFIYSGELSNAKVKQWLDRQIAGSRYIEEIEDKEIDRKEYVVNPIISSLIADWYRDYLYTYGDEGENREDDLIEIMEYAYKRHNVKRFVIDNLKTLKFANEREFYRAQGLFVARLKTFARNFNVHIDLVVHPRKTQGGELADEDIGGSVDIIDLADNIIVVDRITEELIDYCKDEDKKIALRDNDTMLTIRKNREYGDVGDYKCYNFNPVTKRIYGMGVNTSRMEWEDKISTSNVILNKGIMEQVEDLDCPF